MTPLVEVLRSVAGESPAPLSLASFEQRLVLSCETLPSASLLCMEKVSTQVQRAPRTPPDGLVVVVDEPLPAPHAQHPLARAARRTMRAVSRRYRRLMRCVPDLLALLQACASNAAFASMPSSHAERLGHSWALAPEASRATRAVVDAALSRGSLSTCRLADALAADARAAEALAVEPRSGAPSVPVVTASPRRNVLDRAFSRGTALAQLDAPSSADGV